MKINVWVTDLSAFFYFLKDKIIFKSQQIKSNHRVLWKNEVDTCGATVFAPDYSATILAAEMCTTPDDILCKLDFYVPNQGKVNSLIKFSVCDCKA